MINHPLEFVSNEYRKRFFFTFLFLTILLFGIFRFLDTPLRTPASPNGIVSFELARIPAQAQVIVDAWSGRTVIYSDGENQNAVTAQPREIFTYTPIPIIHASFGLGIDYLFMPLYAFALSFGTLLAAGKHSGWFRLLGTVAGYGAFAAALFDTVENYALIKILLGTVASPYPEISFYCASIKFGLLIFGLLYALTGWLLPQGKR